MQLFTTDEIDKMAKKEANNDDKHAHVKLDYQDGIYYGFRAGFEKALNLLSLYSIEPPINDSDDFICCNNCKLSLDESYTPICCNCKDYQYYEPK